MIVLLVIYCTYNRLWLYIFVDCTFSLILHVFIACTYYIWLYLLSLITLRSIIIFWLFNCSFSRVVTVSYFICRRPADIIHCSAQTKEKLAEQFDCYGDSYTEEISVDELKIIFERVKEQVSRKKFNCVCVCMCLCQHDNIICNFC